MTPDRPPARVAVVAIHGVGSPDPLSTARALVELLVQHQPNGASFGAFEEHQLIIPTQPLRVTPSDPPPAAQRPRNNPASLLSVLAQDRSVLGRNTTEASSPDVAFMRSQLEAYDSERQPYDTAEFVGERRDVSGEKTAVHVFEMHWADLSRVGSGILRVLGAVYQLILHISHLGRKTLDIGAQFAPQPEDQKLNESWRRFSDWHAGALRFFTIGVPVPVLLMLSAAALFIPAGIDATHRPVVAVIATLTVALFGVGVFCFTRLRGTRSAHLYVTVFLLLSAAAVWLCVRIPRRGAPVDTLALSASVGVVVVAAYSAILRLYDQSQPGSRRLGAWAAFLILGLTAFSCVRLPISTQLDSAEWVRQAAFFAFQWGWVLFSIAWMGMWVVSFVAFILGIRVRLQTANPAALARLVRASWTARVTLALALFAFTLLLLVGYEMILTLAIQHTSYVDLVPKAELQTVSTWFLPARYGSAADFLEALVAAGGTATLPYTMMGLAVALLLVAWFIALIALTSVHTPKQTWPFAQQLGDWFTAGFTWLRTAGNLVTFVIFAGFSVGGVVAFAPAIFHFSWTDDVTSWLDPRRTTQIVHGIAYAMLASAATLAAVQVRLAAITTQARPAIGIILDVDNYLRESPRSATPRARMTERFASLLRHITERKDGHGAPFFDRIVLVSHSQGTVIAADFLRFISEEKIASPEVLSPRFRLLTMGSPLRQLYAQHFPYLYGWIDASADVHPPLPGGALAGKSPHPSNLRVGKWVNLYTSGDYVGRTLWQDEHAAGIWAREPFGAAQDTGDRRERCLGAGTHTHYWTSGDVAEEVDALLS